MNEQHKATIREALRRYREETYMWLEAEGGDETREEIDAALEALDALGTPQADEWEDVADGEYQITRHEIYKVEVEGRRVRRYVDNFYAGTFWIPSEWRLQHRPTQEGK